MGILYENSLVGGAVTCGGWSPTAQGGGTGTFTLNMTGALFIFQAYLIAGRCGLPTAPLTVQLNNGSTTQAFTFSPTNRVGQQFTTSFQNSTGLSAVHAIDVTSFITTTATNYTLTIPAQVPVVQRYTDFSLVVVYQVASLLYSDIQIFINENNIGANNSRTLNFVNTIDNANPVPMGLLTGYCCNNVTSGNQFPHDSTNVRVNATSLGNIGSTTGDGYCGGAGFISPIGNFRYTNPTLTAGANCNVSQAVSGLDALSDIKTPVGAAATSYVLQFNAVEAGNTTNNLWGVVTAFTHTNVDYEADFGITPTVTNITTTGATVNFSPQYITPWTNQIQWRLWQTTVWTSSASQVNTTSFNITGLITNTAYEYRILNIDADGAILRPSAIQRFITA